MNPTKITPMIQQYLSIKESYPDAVLFYRMGDFYEMFFEDAKLASRILEITLTSRNKNDEVPVPMCGVPYRAAKGYISRLIENGLKVAVCDQVEDPSQAKGLVKRDVVRVITPGMITEDEYLDKKTNNFILALFHQNNTTGIAYIDISTGAFRLTESTSPDKIREEIHRVSPSELLLPETLETEPVFLALVSAFSQKAVSCLEEEVFGYERCRERLLSHFKVLSLEGFGCESLKRGVSAAGALLSYVRETQKQPLSHLVRLESYSLDHFLSMDEKSCKNLELTANIGSGGRHGSLIGVLDETVTAMGGRLLKRWLRYPLMDPQAIESRLDAVEEAKNKIREAGLIRESLKAVYDLERINGKIALGHANARDLLALRQSLEKIPDIKTGMGAFSASLFAWDMDFEPLVNLAGLISKAIREDAPPTVNEGGMIRPGFHVELDELIEINRNGKGWLAKLEVDQKAETGISSLKVRYNKVFGYYIEVPKAQAGNVPSHYIRKQTLVNAERYITEDLKHFESNVLNAEERRASLEFEIFCTLRSRVMEQNQSIQQAADFIANLDCLLALGTVADANHYHRPQINHEGRIAIEDSRHPVVEKMIPGERFVPNSIDLDNTENQILIITGPNMAGKSTILRQAALTSIMAQMGSFVPAAKASLCLVDKIFTRIGALDNLASGQSTFMVEMQETANILNNATENSLIILDEIGRGTSTFDGLSIAWAVAEYLHDLKGKGVKTLFATHYHKLTDLVQTKPRVKNYHVAVKEWNDEIIFLRKLTEGSTSRSYGIQVARLAGAPETVISRAKSILNQIENEENGLNGIILEENRKSSPKKGHVQLPLFEKTENIIMNLLRSADISRMTPMDAMNCLNDLIQKSRDL
jgi:DNA mismatch repair protein MutS